MDGRLCSCVLSVFGYHFCKLPAIMGVAGWVVYGWGNYTAWDVNRSACNLVMRSNLVTFAVSVADEYFLLSK